MTAQEINEAVARKLGYKIWEDHIYNKQCDYEPIPDYCHDIKAAWEVSEYMCEKGTSFILNYAFDDRTWECSWITGDKRYTSVTDTAPMAICLAFVKLT